MTSKNLWHRSCSLLALCLLWTLSISAQDTLRSNKVITNAQLIGIGAVNVLDTYLSPEEYTGGELRYLSVSERENGTKLSRELVHRAHVLYVHNRVDNNNEIGGWYNFQYNLHYRLLDQPFWKGHLVVKAGGGFDANVGFLYNNRNQNNPAQAYVQLNLAPGVLAAYRFRVKNHPMQVRYELQFPLVGLAFSPHYGQSYYEIFTKDNYDHNIVPTTLISTPSFRQLLTIDYTIKHTTLRVGYESDIQQAKLNGLKSHTWSNLLVVGIVRKFSITKILP